MHVYLQVGDQALVFAPAAVDVGAQLAVVVVGVRMRLVDPEVIDRTTGAVRDVGAFVELPPQVLACLLAMSVPPANESGSVVAVLVHRMSRRAVVVGPFGGVAAARSWWSAPRNRLAGNPAMVMVVLPVPRPVTEAEEG